MITPTFPQMQHFFALVAEGKITTENFQKFLGNPNGFTTQLFPSLIHAPELIPEYTNKQGIKRKWEIVEDVEPTLDLDVSKLKPRSFLRDGDGGRISGEEMRRRAVEFGANLGLSDGKRMLEDGGKLIPVEFRGFYIPLPGTKLRGSDGGLCVPCLVWRSACWVLPFGWLGYDWDDDGRFARRE